MEPWAVSGDELPQLLELLEPGSGNATAAAVEVNATAAAAAEDEAGPVLAYDRARLGPLPSDVRMCGDVARRAADAIGRALRAMQVPRLQVQEARVEFSLVPGEQDHHTATPLPSLDSAAQ